MKKCKIKYCNRKYYVRGYCRLHYERIRKKIPLNLPPYCNKGQRNGNWKGGVAEYPNHYLMKKQRLIILKNNPLCEYCGKRATQIHHKDEKKQNHKLTNLVAVCHICNSRQSSKFYKRFGYTLDQLSKLLGRSKSYWWKHRKKINHFFLDKSPIL